jgi:hypothetical protein
MSENCRKSWSKHRPLGAITAQSVVEAQSFCLAPIKKKLPYDITREQCFKRKIFKSNIDWSLVAIFSEKSVVEEPLDEASLAAVLDAQDDHFHVGLVSVL